MKARLAAYQEALKQKRELHKAQVVGADTAEIKNEYNKYVSPRRAARAGVAARMDPSKISTFQLDLTEEEREIEIENRARQNLHRMFQVVDGKAVKTGVAPREREFHHNRGRYLDVVGKLRPDALPAEKGEKKKEAIASEVVKKETYESLKSTWDDYEIAARDRPKEPTDEEKKMRETIAKVEDRIDMDWVHYVEEVVKRAVKDQDTDEAEIKQWQGEVIRIKTESKQRRKRKIKQEKEEEKEYWKNECDRLKQEIDDQSEGSSLASDEEWVSDSEDLTDED